MQADTTICNLALAHLKVTDQIANVQTEDSPAARQCRLHWTPVVREVLRAYPWRFAVGRWNLGGPSDSDKPVFGWEYAYRLPQECLRVIKVFGADGLEMSGPGSWEKEGECILTNEEGPLYLKGIKIVENAAKYDASFVNALGYRLAAQIAPGLGEGKSQGDLLSSYLSLVHGGQSVDSTEASQPQRHEGGWVKSFRG
ncbi:hypothetical protein [Pseudodesulfovibrio pelocollis]|uniref:hypothetical protein n=1 Tax=Pseudodesulfovibrio pelocollis TaxID=3051432 RepID=UPI00255B2BC6|nr:hypothetical protein [Pseudodesulfovibrio sp. SB368]